MKATTLLPVLVCALCLAAPAAWAEDPDYGDEAATAAAITTDGTDVAGVIDPSGDQDWFWFAPAGNARYRLSFLNGTANWKEIRVFQADDFGVLRETMYKSAYDNVATLEVFFNKTNDVYLRVQNGAGDYAVNVEYLDSTPPDGYAEMCDGAAELTVDAAPTVGTIAPDNAFDTDVDWLRFGTEALHKYRVTLRHTENSWVRFRLWPADCDGTQIFGDATSLTVVSWYGEDYHLQTIGDLKRQGNYYDIQVEDIDSYTDDHGNTHLEATPIAADGTEAFGDIEYEANVGSDQDWFSFQVPDHARVRLSMNNSATNWKEIRMFYLDEFDVLREVVYFSAYNATDHRDVFLNRAGTCFVRVQNGLGGYALSAEVLDTVPPDGYGDTCADADALIVDADPLIGTVAPDNEEFTEADWFMFQTQPLHKYQVDLTHTANSWVRFQLFPADCHDALIHGDATSMTFVSWYGDPFHLYVRGDLARLGNWYTLAVTDLGEYPDDFGNTPMEAATIVKDGTWVDGEIQYEATRYSDEDWMRFVAPVDGDYEIRFDNAETNWKELRLFRMNEFDIPEQITNYSVYHNVDVRTLALTAGVHYIRIINGMGQYRVSVESPEPRCGDLDHPYPAGDANQDCQVNLLDLAELAQNWLIDARPVQ